MSRPQMPQFSRWVSATESVKYRRVLTGAKALRCPSSKTPDQVQAESASHLSKSILVDFWDVCLRLKSPPSSNQDQHVGVFPASNQIAMAIMVAVEKLQFALERSRQVARGGTPRASGRVLAFSGTFRCQPPCNQFDYTSLHFKNRVLLQALRRHFWAIFISM